MAGISFKILKNCTGSILKVSMISLYSLISYSLLTQLWAYSHHISLNGDIELNPGPRRDMNQFFSVCYWNLNSVASHNFSKLQFLIAYNCIHKFDIICFSEYYLNSEIFQSVSNLQIPGYNLARIVCICNTNVHCL